MEMENFKASDSKAFLYLIVPMIIAVSGSFLSVFGTFWIYILGQLFLSIFFLQTFILLHECGHLNYFRKRELNVLFGNLFGILTMIPFFNWQHMHNLHHRWTGWRDKDPTTEKTVAPSDSFILRIVANVAWWLFIPVFYLTYKISNYWDLFKIKRFLNADKYRKAKINVLVYLLFYIMIFYFFGSFLIYCLPAFIFSLILKELVILTQHSHIEIPVSEGKDVRPIPYKDQLIYTRSFHVNPFVANFILLNFNLHEMHHAYPGLPAYYLHKAELGLKNEPGYWKWFFQAKSMKGEDYIFRTSKQTGRKI